MKNNRPIAALALAATLLLLVGTPAMAQPALESIRNARARTVEAGEVRGLLVGHTFIRRNRQGRLDRHQPASRWHADRAIGVHVKGRRRHRDVEPCGRRPNVCHLSVHRRPDRADQLVPLPRTDRIRPELAG